MGSAAGITETVLYDTLVNYLISMARTVEGAMNRALEAIVSVDAPKASALTGEVFLLEPRINEMEIVIDEHAIRLLRRGGFSDDEMRLIVAALKITNDLERIGDLAVNLAERVTTLREMPGSKAPTSSRRLATNLSNPPKTGGLWCLAAATAGQSSSWTIKKRHESEPQI